MWWEFRGSVFRICCHNLSFGREGWGFEEGEVQVWGCEKHFAKEE